MNAELILKNINGEIVAYFFYAELATNTRLKKEIKTKYLDTGKYKLFCGCKDGVEMRIDNTYKRIYPAKQGIEHNEGCPRENVVKTLYSEAWSTKSKDNRIEKVSVRLKFSLDPTKVYKEKPVDYGKKDNLDKRVCFSGRNYQVDGKVTVSALIKNLNTQTWSQNAFARSKNGLKENAFQDKFQFLKAVCYTEAKKIELNAEAKFKGTGTKNLGRMLFRPSRDKDMDKKDVRFVYMYFYKIEDYGSFYKVTCQYVEENRRSLFPKYFFFTVEKKKFEAAVKKSNLNIEKLYDEDIIVGGFVTKNKKDYMELFEVAVVRCNKYGLYSESSYEAEFYNMLSDNNKIFYKPNRPMAGYKNYIPDAIILENGVSKEIFVEIFGYNSVEYRREREEKLRLMNTDLVNSHYLIYWDALDNEEMPTIEEINSILENLKNNDN